MSGSQQPNAKLVSAAVMARALSTDAQFTPPLKPRLAQELMMVPLPDGLLFEGAAERQVLRGKAVNVLLPRLLPLLDGTRTAVEIQAALPDLPAQAIVNALALLYTRGLLEDGSFDTPATACDDPIMGFFRRNIDATRMNRSAVEATARIAEARISVLGIGDVAKQAAVALRRNGFSTVIVVADVSAVVTAAPSFVVAVQEGEEAVEQLMMLDAVCAEAGVSWLRTGIYGEKAMIGPYFDRGETPCYGCFTSHRKGDQPVSSPMSAAQRLFWAERLAVEVIYMVSFIAPPQEHDVTEIDLRSWTQRKLRMPPVPGCAICCPAPAALHGEVPAAFAYEHAVSFPSRKYLVPKDHQMHYRASNLDLSKETKAHPSATADDLPPLSALPAVPGCFLGGPVAAPWQAMDRAHVGTLLTMTTGIRSVQPDTGKVQRWAPTGGNLGSVHAFVLARNVVNLAPGWYSYEAGQHSLSRVGPRCSQEQVQAVMTRLAPPVGPSPDLLLVLIGAVGRVSHKYGLFGYRIVHLDAGVAVAQAMAVCDAFGWRRQFVPWSPEGELVEMLRMDTSAEQPTAIVAVFAGGDQAC